MTTAEPVKQTAEQADSGNGRAAPDCVVFFDGICGMCNNTVNMLMARDPEGRLKFAPLQGKTAQQLVPSEYREKLNTFVFLQDGRLHVRTTAFVRILWVLGGVWGVLGTLLWLVPSPLRNLVYRCVSRFRYRVTGKSESCRLPTADERARFLE